jgi:hypothetical protein
MDKKTDMTELDNYLAEHYLNAQQLSALCEISEEELYALILAQLIPEASYIVNKSGTIRSFVFGEMPAAGALPGEYFHRRTASWIKRTRAVIAHNGLATAHASLKQDFITNYRAALADLNTTLWRLSDSFSEDGTAIESGLQARAETAWKYFLNGTFGLCVFDPVSEAAIARKEVLQEKLTSLSENGLKTTFSPTQAQLVSDLIETYARATMPFSPVEYAISSRKRLVDDLKARLLIYLG